MTDTLFLGSLALAANLATEVFLRQIGKQFGKTRTPWRKSVRLVALSILPFVCAALTLPHWQILFVTLLGVSCASDFESTYLPPDWFTVGATVTNLTWGWLTSDDQFRGIAVSQALGFVLGILLVRSGAMAGGDIKLMTQYGAAATHPAVVVAGFVIDPLLRAAFLVTSYLVLRLRAHTSASAWAQTKTASIGPHGTIAFVSLLLALCVSHVGNTP